MMVPLELVRCDRCGVTLYAKPHGVSAGEMCCAPIPGEYIVEGATWTGEIMLRCSGTLVSLGRITPPSEPSA
jgi:hypothetical protein